jgi:hypothetical protein
VSGGTELSTVPALARGLVEQMPELTVTRAAEAAMRNAEHNQGVLARSVKELEPATPPSQPAIVVSAGPSLHRHGQAEQLRAASRYAVLVAVDAALGYCLREDLTPDYVVSVDPHATRILRWFGDPELERRPDDDYFRRQELDPYVHEKERQRNAALVEAVDRSGPSITALLASSVSPSVVARCRDAGMQLFGWNPMLDDPAPPGSWTRRLHVLNGLPALMTGGNVGTAAWVIAHSVLRHRCVLLVGMDLGYAPGTSLHHTQYHKDLVELFGDRAAEAFIEIDNPHTGERWFTDPTYYWYREVFLELAAAADCRTVNCTGGGTLFGPGVEWCDLAAALRAA